MNETNYNETTNDAGAQEIIGHDGGEMMFRGGMVPYSTECTQDDSTQYTFTIGGRHPCGFGQGAVPCACRNAVRRIS